MRRLPASEEHAAGTAPKSPARLAHLARCSKHMVYASNEASHDSEASVGYALKSSNRQNLARYSFESGLTRKSG